MVYPLLTSNLVVNFDHRIGFYEGSPTLWLTLITRLDSMKEEEWLKDLNKESNEERTGFHIRPMACTCTREKSNSSNYKVRKKIKVGHTAYSGKLNPKELIDWIREIFFFKL